MRRVVALDALGRARETEQRRHLPEALLGALLAPGALSEGELGVALCHLEQAPAVAALRHVDPEPTARALAPQILERPGAFDPKREEQLARQVAIPRVELRQE